LDPKDLDTYLAQITKEESDKIIQAVEKEYNRRELIRQNWLEADNLKTHGKSVKIVTVIDIKNGTAKAFESQKYAAEYIGYTARNISMLINRKSVCKDRYVLIGGFVLALTSVTKNPVTLTNEQLDNYNPKSSNYAIVTVIDLISETAKAFEKTREAERYLKVPNNTISNYI
jgi:hypothetical protein